MQVSKQINARWIIPVDETNTVLENHALIIQDDLIVDILPLQAANKKYTATELIELNDHVIVPGFINAHTHSAMSLLKGLADDLPLDEWLNQHIWPAESAIADQLFVKEGTELAVAEMIKSGTTCFNDMYFFPDQTAKLAQHVGIRACIGLPVIDFPTRWAKNLDEYISKGLDVYDSLKNEPLISFTFAPHAPYTVSDTSLKKVQSIMHELELSMHIHLHETNEEVQNSIKERSISPLTRLHELDLLGPELIAVHMTSLNDDDIKLLAEFAVNVIHCPESNLKLASGFCPTKKLLAAGVNVAIGTDGSASNNDIDMLGEMRTAALLAKGVSGEASALPAHQALQMATLNGAKALGLSDKIGSLTVGKQADITAIDLNQLETQPIYDVISTLIYSANRSQVSDVWVAGKALLKNHTLTNLDEAALILKAQQWQEKIKQYHHCPNKAVKI